MNPRTFPRETTPGSRRAHSGVELALVRTRMENDQNIDPPLAGYALRRLGAFQGIALLVLHRLTLLKAS